MPDPKDNAKQRGDIHPPEVESDLPYEGQMTDSLGTEGTPGNRGKATERADIARPGRGSKKAGVLKDKDDETSDSYGATRDSGDRPGPGRG
jgi:hypothetical protein